MQPSSHDYADISEGEMDAHTQKTLEELQNGQCNMLKRMAYRCAFCSKYLDPAFVSILEHAEGVAKGYQIKHGVRAKHKALAQYLRNLSDKEKVRRRRYENQHAKE